MKIVIAGGTGHLGVALTEYFQNQNHDVVVLSRRGKSKARLVAWDGVELGSWINEIEGASIIINLAGRSVDCRYTARNLKQMMDSRVDSTRVIGEAIAQSKNPPNLWLQMSTATIYSHRFDQTNDEITGILGGHESDVPKYWRNSIEIAKCWEKTLFESKTPSTRKVALRSAMVMGPDPKSVFGVLSKMTKLGLGGSIAGGEQFVSWIHEKDFLRAIDFIIKHKEIHGSINLCAPDPIPQKAFMKQLRQALHVRIGLPSTSWMAEIGAFILRTDTELLLKSRRVVPTILLRAGFKFLFPTWQLASADLVQLPMKIIFFDGYCSLCNGFVDWAMKRDKKCQFKFASLQGEAAKLYLKETRYLTEINTIVYFNNGQLDDRASAVLHFLDDLGGFWKISKILMMLPISLQNFIYNKISKNRYKLFKKRDTCRLPNADERDRLLN